MTDPASWLLEHGENVQYGLFFGLLPLLLVVERILPFRRLPGDAARLRTNAALTLLAVLSLGIVPVSFIGAAMWADARGVGLLNLAALPPGVVIVATLLLRGGLSTLTHWLNHRVPLLWRLHRVHHLDTELDVSSTVRFHPLEMPVNALIGVPLVVALGLSPWVLVIYEFLDVAVTLFSHSNLQVPAKLDRWLRYVLVTPNLHRVHHSSFRPETDSNYGAVFPIWDVVFGTFRSETREPQEAMELGLEDVRGPAAQRLLGLLVSPLYRDLSRLDRRSAGGTEAPT
ncbi:MAG: sterol desaturase family protein [Pseudomonadales bacterium]